MIPKRIILVTFIIIGLGLAFVFVFSVKRELSFSETMAFAQFVFTILAFSAVLYTLYYASAQFRKSMAKPKLRVVFEDGKTEATITVEKTDRTKFLNLRVINTGSAITKTFQIDFETPNIFNADFGELLDVRLPRKQAKISPDNLRKTISLCSDEKIYCFVDRANELPSLHLEIHEANYEKYQSKYLIPYKIFGDWAEAQEGKLRIIVKKNSN